MKLGATHAARLRAQLLSGPRARYGAAVVDRLLAVQAQDARGARLAVRSRSVGTTAADLDAALNDRSMLIAWLNRGTLHLVAADDYWWLHPLSTPQLETGNRRRLRQEGVSARQADRGVEVVTDAVRSHGPQTRADLRRRLDAARVPTAGQAFIHVLVAASLRNQLVRGPMRGREHAFVAASDREAARAGGGVCGRRAAPRRRPCSALPRAARSIRGGGRAVAGRTAQK